MTAISMSPATAAAPRRPGAHPAAAPGRPLRAVLDTNVWLDLMVFRDPGAFALARALEDGRLQARMDDFGAAELARVLATPLGRLRLDPAAQAQVLAACGRLGAGAVAAGLPRCRDPDDQPFLALAGASGADWLVTKDRDLLTLARRAPFLILSPGEAARRLGPSAPAGPG